ncbi:hypothetical protein AVEN_26392-1 [Araneus ventricosus]|uniref:Uncharacterized protein n=1 Tax=Araneus ventricosus TaxID=182803 RepID=A0A4Y2G355_ARAVE|nr:hypothetical protein AVEN_16227-1 [Araneus ventricosus]GBM46294.1 hypothetical protein AVEN_26392-1 [Araneus ventricosus]
MDLVILNRSGMKRTALELVPSSPNFRSTPAGGRLTQVKFNRHQTHKHGGSSLKSGFEPAALRLRSQDPTTRPPRFKIANLIAPVYLQSGTLINLKLIKISVLLPARRN